MKVMKKTILLAIVAPAFLFGCSRYEVPGDLQVPGEPIGLNLTGTSVPSDAVAGDTKAQTYTTENLDSLYVDCYFADTHELYFSDQFKKNSAGEWKTSKVHYWLLGKEFDFVFRTEIESMDHYSFNPETLTGTFDYEAVEFSDAKDMMLCVAPARSQKTCTKPGAVDVVMEHTLSAIRFKASAEMPDQVVFNEISLSNMRVTGICTFSGAVKEDLTTKTDIKWKVSKLYNFDIAANYSRGRILDGLEGVDGLVSGEDFTAGEYIDKNQILLENTFLVLPGQKLSEFGVRYYTGMLTKKFVDVDVELERSKCYIFVLNVTARNVNVEKSFILNDWIPTAGINIPVY